MARITVYNLGEQGVNLTKSPVHQSDGELLQAQNAIRSLNNVDGGIVKREALTQLTSTNMDGTVRGMIGLPLPNPLATPVLYAWVTNPAGGTPTNSTYKSSNGGTSWAFENTLAPHCSAAAATSITTYTRTQRSAVNGRRRRFYYWGLLDGGIGVGKPPAIWAFDGDTNRMLCRLPPNPNAVVSGGVVEGLDMLTVGQLIYVSTYDGTSISGSTFLWGSVYRLDENGVLTRIGQPEDLNTGAAFCLCWHADKLWVGTTGDMPQNPPATVHIGKVYSIRPFLDSEWTADSLALSLGEPMVTSMASFNGDLYLSTAAASGTASKIRKRTPAGVWSTVYTNASTANDNQIVALHVYDSALYAVRLDHLTLATQTDILRSTNGSAWSVDRDVTAADPFSSNIPGSFLTIGNDLFLVMDNGNILRRRSGTWSLLDSGGQSLRGPIAYIRPKN